MPLVKTVLETSILEGLKKVMDERSDNAESGKESQDPKEVTAQVAKDMAKVLSDAIDAYIKSGDIFITGTNVMVVCSSLGSPAAVSPLIPIHIE